MWVSIDDNGIDCFFLADSLQGGEWGVTDRFNGVAAGRLVMRLAERLIAYQDIPLVFLDDGSFMAAKNVRVRRLRPTEKVTVTRG